MLILPPSRSIEGFFMSNSPFFPATKTSGGEEMNLSIKTRSIEDAAILRAHGFSFSGGSIEDGRVTLEFRDQNGNAGQLLETHGRSGININSQELLDAVRWAKDRIFSTRRTAGLD
jgi:hypothetical protein